MEFMRIDIEMWKTIKPDVNLVDIREILKGAKINKGSVETIKALREKGVKTCIISGGIDLIADEVGKACGVDRVMANGIEADENGKLTGEGILRVHLRDKARTIRQMCKEFNVAPERCAAVGNSWVDIPMFDVVAFSIAFNPIDGETITAANVTVESDDLRDILPHLDPSFE